MMIKRLLVMVCVLAVLASQASAYEEGDKPLEFEVGIGTSWGETDGASSGAGFEFEVGGKVGYFFSNIVGVMGGATLDYFSTPYSWSGSGYSLDVDVSAICLTLPAGVYVSPSGGLIFGGGFSLSIPLINLTDANDSYGSANGNDVVKLQPFFNFYIDAGYDFGESLGKGIKLLLRYSKSLSDISPDGYLSKDFLHLMIGYSYITY
ncbi:MAG: porin family protein [Spirochaetales bacterium]|jgi:hypothetical protein|nr:porin family protein [Spirochaetales bacterium]